MARMIYTCRNKACKKSWAFDYPHRHTFSMGYGRKGGYSYRVIGDRRVQMGFDSTCPDCHREHARGNAVKGYTTAHVCDARCTNATGPNCECSCGGKNHGQSFICIAA
jgi:hypothetical protein